MNPLLIVRHYCFSLPFHYLCCSCNLSICKCFKWLAWCCCCCCCCNFLCSLAVAATRTKKHRSTAADKRKAGKKVKANNNCDKRAKKRRPKLVLVARNRGRFGRKALECAQRSPGGATRRMHATQAAAAAPPKPAYVIGFNVNKADGKFFPPFQPPTQNAHIFLLFLFSLFFFFFFRPLI